MKRRQSIRLNHVWQYGRYHVALPEERTMDGILFASKAEMRRYAELKILKRSGKIKDLTLQPRFELCPAFVRHGIKYHPLYYVADFEYYDVEKKRKVIEDVKGVETEVFKIKEKLLAFRHNIELRIVKTSEIGK